MDEGERASKPLRAEIPTDPEEIALLEARNGLRQVDAIRELIHRFRSIDTFKLRISDILKINRITIEGVNPLAGVFRPSEMEISLSRHHPPPPYLVPGIDRRDV
jgi:hypothetical protein